MFLTFSFATEGDAPSISATFIMSRTLTDRRIDDSGFSGGYLKLGPSSVPAKCLRPTPQKILLSPLLGKTSRFWRLGDRWMLSGGLITFF